MLVFYNHGKTSLKKKKLKPLFAKYATYNTAIIKNIEL